MEAFDRFTGEVTSCDEKGAWHCLAIPAEFNEVLRGFPQGHFGYVPITAKISSSQWDTSFLPKGDGSYFFTLPAKVRKAQHIFRGDVVTVEFCPRP